MKIVKTKKIDKYLLIKSISLLKTLKKYIKKEWSFKAMF